MRIAAALTGELPESALALCDMLDAIAVKMAEVEEGELRASGEVRAANEALVRDYWIEPKGTRNVDDRPDPSATMFAEDV